MHQSVGTWVGNVELSDETLFIPLELTEAGGSAWGEPLAGALSVLVAGIAFGTPLIRRIEALLPDTVGNQPKADETVDTEPGALPEVEAIPAG